MNNPATNASHRTTSRCDGEKGITPVDALDALRVAFPAWSVFRSDAGVFYATRRGVRLRDADIDKGLRQTVCADDATAFLSLLEDQTRMAATS
ncbi:hypothetical protein [Nonomuraea phyllanthi]|uniref:hypothetical protein n=1 Tax=Nonomuraea phyllanthi TaxID=2219224 RepID=UPI001D143DA4|nr:hypothetical protein [Nonomuraea phyllanthi]